MIAYGTGKAGQFAKDRAERHFRAFFMVAVLAAGGVMFLVGMASGIAFVPAVYRYVPAARRVPWVAYYGMLGGSMAAAGAMAWVMFGRSGRTLDKLALTRVRVLHGGIAEAIVAHSLTGLSDDWHLFNNVAMKGGGDVDHVLVGPGGLFAVQTKSARGTYGTGADGRLTLNGDACDHVVDAQRRAMQLRHWLEAMLNADPAVRSVPYVRPVLVAPFAHVAFGAMRGNVWVMDDRALCNVADESRRTLKAADVDGCVAVLKRLTGWEPIAPKPVAAAG